MLGLALILAGASAFLVQQLLPGQNPRTVEVPMAPPVQMAPVVVAATPVYSGNTARREHLREVEWRTGAVPSGSFASVEDVLGADGKRCMALQAIKINEPLLKNQVAVVDGVRAMTIRVRELKGVLPGDYVTIWLRIDTGTIPRNYVLLRDVKILAINRRANAKQIFIDGRNVVTLEVTHAQGQKLAWTQRHSQFSLHLGPTLLDISPRPIYMDPVPPINSG
jgi:pilus assembly protein CpaB